nr:MAG TPA: hypothetical protein [Caudoviricetes sp.]
MSYRHPIQYTPYAMQTRETKGRKAEKNEN